MSPENGRSPPVEAALSNARTQVVPTATTRPPLLLQTLSRSQSRESTTACSAWSWCSSTVSTLTGWNVPAERGDTLSGLVFNELGRAPRKGDTVVVPGYSFTVADISGTRITQVRVRREEEEEAPPEETAVE